MESRFVLQPKCFLRVAVRFELAHLVRPMLLPFGRTLLRGLPKVARRARAVAVRAAEVGLRIFHVNGRWPQLGGAVVLQGAWGF